MRNYWLVFCLVTPRRIELFTDVILLCSVCQANMLTKILGVFLPRFVYSHPELTVQGKGVLSPYEVGAP